MLGWVDLSSHGGAVAAASGEEGRPGIGELSPGTVEDERGYGMLMYQSNSIILGGGLNHIIDFSISRVDAGSTAEWRAGFMQSSGDVGAYFKFIPDATTGGHLWFTCQDASGNEEHDLLSDPNAKWFRYRIEVAPDASQVCVYRSGTGSHEDLPALKLLRIYRAHIPTGACLGFAFRIRQDLEDGETNGLLRVDYFQHQVY